MALSRETTPPKQPQAGRRSRSAAGKRKSKFLIAGIVVVFVIGLVWSIGIRQFLSYIYQPTAILIVVALMAQYIILKGRDRSRIYRIELDKLRKRRDREVTTLRRVEREIAWMETTLQDFQEQDADAAKITEIRARLEQLRHELEQNV